jgi:hypothetical protein
VEGDEPGSLRLAPALLRVGILRVRAGQDQQLPHAQRGRGLEPVGFGELFRGRVVALGELDQAVAGTHEHLTPARDTQCGALAQRAGRALTVGGSERRWADAVAPCDPRPSVASAHLMIVLGPNPDGPGEDEAEHHNRGQGPARKGVGKVLRGRRSGATIASGLRFHLAGFLPSGERAATMGAVAVCSLTSEMICTLTRAERAAHERLCCISSDSHQLRII